MNSRPKSLRLEIATLLLFKACALGLIWTFCFSSPVASTQNESTIRQHILTDTQHRN